MTSNLSEEGKLNNVELPKFRSNALKSKLFLRLLILLLLGFCLRFVNLDRSVYWHDEAYTSLRISGYTATDVHNDLFNSQIISLDALQKYQRLNPDKTVLDTVQSLAIEDPQHPPLYYVLVRQWASWFGHSVASLRSLSVLISLLMVPCAYWFCRELFAFFEKDASTISPRVMLTAEMFIALIAVSPYQVLYAQEAREYVLWAVLILLSSATLLRAMRVNTLKSWGAYIVSLVLGLYTHPLMVLVAIAQSLYLLIVNRLRWTRRVKMGLLSIALGFLAFTPWLGVIVQSWGQTGTSWMSIPIPLISLLKTWGLHLERAFILTVGDFGFDHWSVYLSLPFLLLLVIYAFYSLCRRTPIQVWLFIVMLTGSVALPLAFPDFLIGGQRSTSSRYLVPFYLGIQVAMAYLLVSKLLNQSTLRRRVWQLITAGVLSVSLYACIINTQAETAWTKVINYNLPTISRLINASPAPLVISTSYSVNFGSILALSHQLDPKVKLQLIHGYKPRSPDAQIIPKIPPGFSDVFVLLNPSETYLKQLEQQQGKKADLLFNDVHLFLWKLVDRAKDRE